MIEKKTTRKILKHYLVVTNRDVRVEESRLNKEWVSVESLKKLLISLAHQKVGNRIKVVKISHYDLLKALEGAGE